MNKPYIFLDAGHGINTSGKRSPFINKRKDYMIEYKFNLSVIIILYTILRDNNYKVDFSSNNIYDIDLKDRIKLVNNNALLNKSSHKPILISIHANAFGDGKSFNDASGIEILCNPNKSEDVKLANILFTEITNNIFKMKNRGIKSRSNLALLNNLNIPACIVEGGFMTNENDLNMLTNYEYQLDLAHALYNGIIKYYE